jgi:hypothetical protein
MTCLKKLCQYKNTLAYSAGTKKKGSSRFHLLLVQTGEPTPEPLDLVGSD